MREIEMWKPIFLLLDAIKTKSNVTNKPNYNFKENEPQEEEEEIVESDSFEFRDNDSESEIEEEENSFPDEERSI